MNLATAQHYAKQFQKWICAFTTTMPEIAGSIRRGRPECGDVDIVCLPLITETRDLFGEVTGQKNLLHEFVKDYVAHNASAKFQSGGDTPGKSMIIQFAKCQLDLWFATPETFATRLMCRTGSKEHNIWLASRAKRMGKKWNPYEGILYGGVWDYPNHPDQYVGGKLTTFSSERDIYAALDLPYIEPQQRELPWLIKTFGAE